MLTLKTPSIAVSASTIPPSNFQGDALVLGLGEDWKTSKACREIDEAMGGLLERLIETNELSSKSGEVTCLLSPNGLPLRALVVVGLGELSKRDASEAFRAAATAAKSMASSKFRQSVAYAGFAGDERFLTAAVIGSITGPVGQDIFRHEPKLNPPQQIQWLDIEPSLVKRGLVIANGMNLTRELVNLPPNYLFPESFAEVATTICNDAGLSIETWDQAKLEQERCGALLAVARGSVRSPRLCIMRYPGQEKHRPPIALVGKGVTFDSGGYSLKPTDSMLTMKSDMAGAATVLGIMQVAAALKIEQPLIGLVGLVENLVSGDAFKLGDVLQARSGKTIEIHNTDAEGRLVLADVLDVALEHKPSRIVDFATLTGACVVALGNNVVGVMSNHENWQSELLNAAKRAGEYAWPLPMYHFFNDQINGQVADIKNIGEGRWAGAITAAKFLEAFVGDVPWIHLDIAGPAFLDSAKPWSDGGGSGTMIRTLIELLDGSS